MDLNFVDLIGLIAASLTTISFLPQTIKTIKTKDTSSISLLMYLLFAIGVLFWGIFGFLINSKIIILANIITLVLALIILMIKIKNIINGVDK